MMRNVLQNGIGVGAAHSRQLTQNRYACFEEESDLESVKPDITN